MALWKTPGNGGESSLARPFWEALWKGVCEMEIRKYPCVYMRGGTSKALVFHEKDLPKDRALWRELFLSAMGSHDPKQIDGMGGAVSSASKIAAVRPLKGRGWMWMIPSSRWALGRPAFRKM